MNKKNIYYLCSNILAWSLVCFLIGNYVFGWTTPSEDPPYSNLPAPINAGTDPQTKAGNLTIEGNLITGGFKMVTGAGADKVLTSDASGIASWQTPAGGSLWTQTGDDIYYNTGNVGIGTTSPGEKLSVAGTVESTTGGFKFPDGSTQTTAAAGGSLSCQTITNACGKVAGCTATCTTGTMVSGGCYFGGFVSECSLHNRPSGNGWYCYAKANPSGCIQKVNTTAYVVCCTI